MFHYASVLVEPVVLSPAAMGQTHGYLEHSETGTPEHSGKSESGRTPIRRGSNVRIADEPVVNGNSALADQSERVNVSFGYSTPLGRNVARPRRMLLPLPATSAC